MSTSDTATLLTQLRTILDVTNTEIQVAETRVAQARTEAVRRELLENAPERPRPGRGHRRRAPRPRRNPRAERAVPGTCRRLYSGT